MSTSMSNSSSPGTYIIHPIILPSPPQKNGNSSPIMALPSIDTVLPSSPVTRGYYAFMPESSTFVPFNQPLSIITDELYLNGHYDEYYRPPAKKLALDRLPPSC